MLEYPQLFVERLGEHDLEVLAGLDGSEPADLRRRLVSDPEALETRLGDIRLFERLFDDSVVGFIRVVIPTLVFAALVNQTMRDLGSTSFVPEWVGAGERLPVFDAGNLREFIDDLTRRYLMIEMLASFTRVASGSMWVRTQRGYRRRRYSELDPLSLAEMVESLPAEKRPAGYRRLGDVALFLTGVFPDHTARHPLSAMHRARLAGTTGLSDADIEYLYFLEAVGSRWYDRAADASFLPMEGKESLHDLAVNFTQARRFLNYLADRYLHRLDTGLMNPVSS